MEKNSRGTMAAIRHGAEVVVIERHSYLAYCEGRVTSTKVGADGCVVVDLTDEQGRTGRHRIPVAYLGPMPEVGARYRWDDGILGSRAPFTVGERFPEGHRFAGLFRLMSDGATPSERAEGHSAIASAAELAKHAVFVSEPDDGTTGEALAAVVPPRRDLDTLRDIVLETALVWDEAVSYAEEGPVMLSAELIGSFGAHRQAIRAYRTARDS